MSSSRALMAGVMACAFLIAGCGQKTPPPKSASARQAAAAMPDLPVKTVASVKPTAAAAMLKLLPADTVALVFVPNLKKFGEGIERIVDATTPASSGRRKAVNLSVLARQAGLDLNDFDLERPAGLAMTRPVSAKRPPNVTAFLPVRPGKDVAAKLRSLNSKGTVEVADGFVVISEKGGYRRAGLPDAMDGPLPDADLVIRLDVPSLWKTYGGEVRSEITRELASMNRDAATVAASTIDTLTSFVESADYCDVCVRIDGTEIEADATIHFAEGAVVPALDVFSKADLAKLARSIPDGGLMSAAMGVDAAKFWAAWEPAMAASLAASPAEARIVFDQALKTLRAVTKSMGAGVAMSGGLKDGRVELVGVVETSNPAAYVAALVEMTSALPEEYGLKPPEKRTVAGASVTTVRLELDLAKMAGTDGRRGTVEPLDLMFGSLVYNFVALDGQALLVVGSDEILERALKACTAGPDAPPTPLAAALAAAGSDTVGYFSLDLAALVRESNAIVAKVGGSPAKRKPAGAPADGTAPLTFVLSKQVDQFRVRASVDVGKTAKLLMAMLPR